MARLTIELPYPPRILSQNSRVNFRAKATATRGYRATCRAISKALNNCEFKSFKKINMTLDFFTDSARELDDDNLIGMFKAGRDGLADGLGVNDVKFKIKGVEQFCNSGERKVIVSLMAGDE